MGVSLTFSTDPMPAGLSSNAPSALDEHDLDVALDRVARLAKAVARSEFAVVSLIEGEQLVHRACQGLQLKPTPPKGAFSKACLNSHSIVWIEDVAQDPAFDGHAFVAGPPHIRFWCGMAFRDPSGRLLGSLGVFDTKPRPFDADVAAALEDLAANAAAGVELRRVRTELKAALDEQGAAMAGMEAFVSQAPVGLAILDRELRFVSASPKWLHDYRLKEDEILGRRQYEVMPFSQRYADIHQRSLQGEACFGEHFGSEGRDGGPTYGRWDVGPWRKPDGEIGGVIVMTYDVTQTVLARQAAERSEQRLKLALEISESVVWEMNRKTGRLHAAGATQAVFGRAGDWEGMDKDILANVIEEDRPRVEAAWDEHQRTGQRCRAEYRLRRTDGTEIWVQSVADTLKDADGAPERTIGVLMNITDRKLGELTEADARHTAEAANRAKTEFLANMSHEIRTPLNGVMGVAGALARTELGSEQRQMVSLIETSAHTLERLLTDLLDLARIESGHVQSQVETFNLGELLEGVCALFEPRAREKGVGFERRIAPTAQASFNGDVTRLKQILSNLLSNAVKFTEAGAVRLIAEVGAADMAENGRLRLRVADTGIGFSHDDKERLFQRFEQADGSITRRYGGTGLGLSISRALAESLGGVLDAESEPGQGAAFTLTVDFPRVSAAEADAAHEQAGADGADLLDLRRPPRILLAEDHPVNRKVVELILASTGVELTSVENGAEAVAQFDLQPFDLILMDMQMPVMDGLTAIRTIRERERTLSLPRTPIVALTANAMPEDQEASRQAGADEHVAKPVSAQVLLDVVARQAISDEPEEMLIAS